MTLARELADTAGRPQVDKNLLINGGMNIWQRSTSETGISNLGNGRYQTADRWDFYSDSIGTWTMAQSTDVPSAQGFGYSLKLDCTTANASPLSFRTLRIQQKIEAQNLQHLLFGTSSPKSITLSFWVKSNKTGTYIINLYREDVSARIISKSYTIDTANTWEKKTITFEGDETNAIANDNGSGIELRFFLAAGSLYTSGTLATSWESITNANIAVGQVNLADSTSNEWYITGCQLEVGEAATDFEFEPYTTTKNKCYRYYFRMEHDNGNNNGFQQFLNGFWGLFNGTTQIGASKITPVEMRSDSLTLTYSSATHFDIEPFDQAPSSIAFQSSSRWGIVAIFTSPTARTIGFAGFVGLDTAGSYYAFDAEL